MTRTAILEEVMRTRLLILVTLVFMVSAAVVSTDAQRRRHSSRASSRRAVVTPMAQTQALVPKIEGKISSLNSEVDRVASRGSVSSTATDTLSDYISRLDDS